MIAWPGQAPVPEGDPPGEITIGSGGGQLVLLLIGLVVLGVVVYVVLRAVQASHQGKDQAGAAATALREVGPPAVALGLLIIIVPTVAGILGVLLLLALFIALLSGDEGSFGAWVAAFYVLAIALVIAVLAVMWWAVARIRRTRRRSSPAPEEPGDRPGGHSPASRPRAW